MKRKSKKSKQETQCEELAHLKGPFFGSDEFVTAYCDRRWETGGRGICGPAAVALAIGAKDGKDFKKVLNAWKRDIGFDGFARVRDVKERLVHYGFRVTGKRVTSRDSKLILPEGVGEALVFIQWEGAKHWLYLKSVKGKLRGACSEFGYFEEGSDEFECYLEPDRGKKNFMRSYLVLERP
jgi:hypothetical protein